MSQTAGLSRRLLAQRVGICDSTLRNVETGRMSLLMRYVPPSQALRPVANRKDSDDAKKTTGPRARAV